MESPPPLHSVCNLVNSVTTTTTTIIFNYCYSLFQNNNNNKQWRLREP